MSLIGAQHLSGSHLISFSDVKIGSLYYTATSCVSLGTKFTGGMHGPCDAQRLLE